MNENEIMTNNEEIMETAVEEIVKVDKGNNFKYVAAIGLGALAGIYIYEYIAKPVVTNFKEKRAAKASLKANPEVYDENIIDDEEIILDEE